MAKDVIITPGSGKIEFLDSTLLKGKIYELDGDLYIDGDTIIFGDGTPANIQLGEVGTAISFTFLGGGDLSSNGQTLNIGSAGDTINLNVSGVNYVLPSTIVLSTDYTDSSVLSKIKNVDGTGSGLDADFLDGQHGAYYATQGQTMYIGTTPVAINRASANLGLGGISSIGLVAHSDDAASISTTVSSTTTYFDFNLADDNGSDSWRWRFTPSGATTYDAMTLTSSTNTSANLVVSGTITATGSGANSTNWTTAYNNRINSFTTTGNSGAATFSSNTLNIPNYTLAGLGGASSGHIHGNIQNNGTISTTKAIANGDRILVADAGNEYAITTGIQIGASTTTYLRNDGTWATPPNNTYFSGTGLTLSGSTFSIIYGTTAGSAAQGNDSRLSDARTPLSHTHGNITNDGKIGATANLVIITGTGGALTTLAAGTTSQFLRGDGAWATPPQGTVTSVSGTGSYGGLTLTGTVTSSGNITFGGTPTGTWPIGITGQAGSVANTLTRGSYLTGNNYNGSAGTTWAVDATTAGAASKILALDANGDTTVCRLNVDGTAGTKSIRFNDNTFISPNSHNNSTWFRNLTGLWTFQSFDDADDWTRVFQLYLPDPGTSGQNNLIAELGQRQSNSTNGSYKGIRIVSYESSATKDGYLKAGNVDISGNLVVSGNLSVGGTTSIIESTIVTIKDPVFTLGGTAPLTTDDNKDRGIEFRWHNGTTAKTGFFGFDDSTGFFTFIPDATNTSEVFSGAQGTIEAESFMGDLIGNADSANYADVAGSVTNTVTFSNTGGAASGTTYDGSSARTIDYSTVGAASSGHVHGNILNGGTITATAITPANTDYILLSDTSNSGKIERGIAIGTGTGTYLRNDGTWATPPDNNTTYSAGTGLNLSTTTFSVIYGTTAGSAAQGNDSRLSDARTPLSHTHGNITNDGKIGATSGLMITTTTAGTLTTLAAGTTSQFLRGDGAWGTPPQGTVTSVSGTGSYGGLTLTGTVTSSGNLTLGGTPTGTWPISVSGNAATVTNGVYTSGSYSDPSWLTISKSKVGLGSVENTALSTWSGSTSITTIGTISTGTVPWARLSGVPSSFTPSSHTHGNIQNNGTISTIKAVANGDRILIADAGNEYAITTGIQIGTSTTTFLRNDGTWSTPPQGTVTSIATTAPISGGTITGSGTISLADNYGDTKNPYASKTANNFLAAPNGAAGVPTFRAIVASDIPTLNQNTTGSAGSVANTLTRGNYLTGDNFNGSVATTWAVDATSSNTVGKVVARDANGDFATRNITATYLNATSINKVFQPEGELRNNLGDPTVEEKALFHGEMSNKFRFIAPTQQEESTNGTTWTTSSRLTSNQLAYLMLGEGTINDVDIIPIGASGSYGGYRLTWDVASTTGYIQLNHLYLYTTTFGNTVTLLVEAFYTPTSTWVNHSGGTFNNWPGHVSYKHSVIAYNTSGSYSKVRITFSTTRSSSGGGVSLGAVEWFGGYPGGKRNVESYDRSKNVTFPASIYSTNNFITSTGKLCIGTSDTTAKVNISGSGINSGNSSIYLTNTSTGGETFQISAGIPGVSEEGFCIRNVTDNNYVISVNGSNQVGIGKYDQSYLLHLGSDSAAKPSTNTWTVSSDIRLKENIIPADLDRCYEIVKQVPLKRYTWRDDVYTSDEVKDRSKLGWIANDVQLVFPKAVDIHEQSLKTYTIVTEEYEEQEVLTQNIIVKEPEIIIVGDHAEEVLVEKTKEVKTPQFYEYNILDKDGNPTGRQHKIPKMITKTIEKKVYDKIEDCLDLNSDQMLAVMYGTIQKLQEKIESLETIIKNNNLV